MLKPTVHIVYITEDGVNSLVSGVGAIADHFLSSIFEIEQKMKERDYVLKLSTITLQNQKNDIGFRSDLLTKSKLLCKRYGGSFIEVNKALLNSERYFDFKKWRVLNKKIRLILNKIYNNKDYLTIILANDTIFAYSYLNRKKIINVWIPHSFSFVHQQSYVNYATRYSWEVGAVNAIKNNRRYFIGSVSDYVHEIIRDKFELNDDKILSFHNGFYLPRIGEYKSKQSSIEKLILQRKIPSAPGYIFCFGRADEYKGLELSLKAMLVIGEKYDLHPIMIASKFSNEDVVRQVQNRLIDVATKSSRPVSLFLDYEFELPKYLLQYKKVKYLLNMPVNDFCPLVPYEAELIGHDNLCIINSAIDCFTYIIKDGIDGFLSKPSVNDIIKEVDNVHKMSALKRHTIIQKGKLRARRQMNLLKNYSATLLHLIETYERSFIRRYHN